MEWRNKKRRQNFSDSDKKSRNEIELAKKEEIDSKKYMEFLESTLEQITSSMDLDFDTMLGKPKQTGLDEFFWS